MRRPVTPMLDCLLPPVVGVQVFQLRLPLKNAPTMNKYASLKRVRWELGRLNKQVDAAILAAKGVWRNWQMGMVIHHQMVEGKRGPRMKHTREGGRRRLVRCWRFSSSRPDEESVDAIGGKLPVDRLVQGEVLRDDNRAWLEREAYWQPAKKKQGYFLVEVFEIEDLTLNGPSRAPVKA